MLGWLLLDFNQHANYLSGLSSHLHYVPILLNLLLDLRFDNPEEGPKCDQQCMWLYQRFLLNFNEYADRLPELPSHLHYLSHFINLLYFMRLGYSEKGLEYDQQCLWLY